MSPETTTLPARCQSLEEQLGRLETAKKFKDSAEGFESRKTNIEEAIARLRPLWAQLEVLRRHGITVDVPNEAWSLRHSLTKARDDYQNDVNSITKSSALPLGLLNNLATKLQANLKAAWEIYADANTVRVDTNLLQNLEGVPSLRAQIAGVRALKSNLELKRLRVPESDDDITAFRTAASNLEDKWKALQSQDVPAAVLEFLQLAGAGGASLDLLTEEVRDWLRAQKLEPSFQVVSIG